MNDEIRMMYGLFGLIIASGLLTWLTKPFYHETVLPKRHKKHKRKMRLRDAQPYLTEDGFVDLNKGRDRLSDKPEQSDYESNRENNTPNSKLTTSP
jgi:hypothetical protein